MAADGSVIIDTGLDTSGVILGVKEIQKHLDSLISCVDALGSKMKSTFAGYIHDTVAAVGNSVSGGTREATQAQAAAARATSDYDKQLAKLQKQIDAAKKQLAGYYQKLEEIHQFTNEALTRAATDRQAGEVLDTEAVQIDALNEKYAEKIALLKDLEAEYARIAEARNASANAPAEASEGGSGEGVKATGEEADKASPKVSVFAYMLQSLGRTMHSVTQSLTGFTKRLARMSFNALNAGIKSAISRLKSFSSQAKKTSLASNALVKSLTSMKRLLITRVKRMFISAIFKDVQEGIQHLARFDSAFNKTMSGIKNRATQVSGNIAVALGNIINALEPVITKILDLMNAAITKVNQFFAVLTGRNSYTAARRGTEDYAKSTDKATKAQKKLNAELYSFDQLNRQSEKNENADSSTGGIQYENLPINLPTSIKDWIERLKKAWQSADWHGVGLVIADGLNAAMRAVDNWINRVFRPLAETWAERVAFILNGIVDGVDWPLIGKTVADGFNALLSAANRFLTAFNFLNLGKGIGAAVKSWFDNIDWALAGQTFANKWNALLHTIEGIVTTPGLWVSIGKSIGSFVKSWFSTIDINSLANITIGVLNGVTAMIRSFLDQNPFEGVAVKIANAVNRVIYGVNWAELGKSLSDLFMGLLGVFREAVQRIDWHGIGQAIGDFLGSIDWAGILSGVAEIVWTVFTGILNGLMSTDGGRMFLALLAALKGMTLAFSLTEALWKAAVQRWIMTGVSPLQSLPQLVGSVVPGLQTALTNLGNMLKTGMSSFTVHGVEYLHGAAAAFATAALAVGDALLLAYDFNALNDAAKTYREAQNAHNREIDTALSSFEKLYREKGPEIAAQWAKTCYQIDTTGMSMSEAQQALTKKIDHYWDNVPQNMWDGFKQGWNTYFGQNGKGLFNLLCDAFDGAVNGVLHLLGINSPSKVFDSIGQNVSAGFQIGFESTWSRVGQNLLQAWTNLKTSLGNIQWSNVGQNMVAGLMNGIGGAWQSLVNSVQNLCSGLINRVKSWFGVHSPSTVFAEIGEYLDAGLEKGLGDGEGKLLRRAGEIASAVTDGMTPDSPDVDVSADGIVGGMQAVLTGLSGIASIFQTIADTLTAMGGLRTPQIAQGTVVPYKTRIEATGPSEGDTDTITSYLLGILSELQAMARTMRDGNDTGDRVLQFSVDGRNIFEVIIDENNRAIRRTGVSPLRA